MEPKRSCLAVAIAALCLAVAPWGASCAAEAPADLEAGFAKPPGWARPWVYWFPLNGNLTKEGITADFEALQRAGIGGALYMEVDQGAPAGSADFAGPLWREMFKHACNEAHRLGLEINMNNDAGWCGSGGPWITPELSMQKVVWTETVIEGGKRFEGMLARPQAAHNYYRDIVVLAMPEPAAGGRLQNAQGKASFKPQHFPPQRAQFRTLPAERTIPRDRIVDLSAKMLEDGTLAWDAPAGRWLVLRFGHTTTGKDNHPAPAPGRGLECDKFSKEAAEAHFNGLMGKLIADNKALTGPDGVLVSTHIDSWEVGSQNWTPRMREEFQRRRGYDLLPFLPAFTGRAVDSLEVSERFLWDLRQTVSDLIVENYAGHIRALANRHGLRLSIEAYDGVPADEMTYAGQADEPMAEFWSWGKYGADYSCTEMASAAHTYGKRILGAEAFTATDGEKWLGHPAIVKDLGDWAFCEGINRFVFHRYAAQPWVNVAPGMSMGPWGLHYERTQTWWEPSRAWHEYLARCQYLLQQGLFVADVAYLEPEGAPRRFAPPGGVWAGPHIRGGYNFDGCTPEVVRTRMKVKDGRLVLPDGMSYRVLVLPQVETMTPGLLAKVKELIEDGAAVIGPSRPVRSPSLAEHPKCDQEVEKLAGEIWGAGPPPAEPAERRLGQGRLVWGGALAAKPTPQAEAQPQLDAAKWIWRKEGNPAVAAPPGTRYFRRVFTVEAGKRIESARLLLTADNSFECWVNGRRVGAGDNFNQAYTMNVAAAVKPGANVVAVAATNGGQGPNPAGLVGLLTIAFHDGGKLEIPTDSSWEAAEKAAGSWTSATQPADDWAAALELGPYGMAPWGDAETPEAGHEAYPDANAIAAWLAGNGVPPDFTAGTRLRYIHRVIGASDVYFVANPEPREIEALATFRVGGKLPEFWWPDTGRTEAAAAFEEKDSRTTVPLRLEPNGSVFVVFRRSAAGADPVVGVTCDGRAAGSVPASRAAIVVQKAVYGVLDDPQRTRDVRAAVQALVDRGELSFQVARMAEGGDPAFRVVKTLIVDYTIGGQPRQATGQDPDTITLGAAAPAAGHVAEVHRGADGRLELEGLQAGHYEVRTASGRKLECDVPAIPAPVEVGGPWEVQFDPKWGGPEKAAFGTLEDWSKRPEDGIRYYSGAATYRATFELPAVAGQRVYLDLGRVAVMAEVKLNGKALGILWKPPYRVAVTDAVKAGANALEVKVVNLWVNRQIGDERLPEDSERNADGTLRKWPDWLLAGKPSPTGRFTFTSWRLWKKDAPLVESGLLGPVTLRAAGVVRLSP